MTFGHSTSIDSVKALAIAAVHLAASPIEDCQLNGLKIVDGDTDHWPFRPVTYGAPPQFPKGCWVVYLQRTPDIIRSSDIIGVCKTTGRVVFSGSANDEG